MGAHGPSRYVEANIAYMARQCAFIRPAFQAALDLDAEIAWDHIRAGIERGLDACTRPLTLALYVHTGRDRQSRPQHAAYVLLRAR